MTQQACIVQHLGIEFATITLFQDLNFQLPSAMPSALIGRNGQGKSILLKLLNQNTDFAYEGQISWQCPIAYLPQLQRLTGTTIADVLEISDLAGAFLRIEEGHADFHDYDLVEPYWHLPAQWQQQLAQANLPTDLFYPVRQLSEGQQTRLALCRLFLMKDHYLLLDEPSNHLDQTGRQWLISQLENHTAGCLVVSHDRALLNQMQHIFLLNEFGLTHYTGNYQHYEQQAALQRYALEKSIAQEKRENQQLAIQQHQTLMKAQKRQSSGRKLRKNGSQAKVLLDFKKEQATQHTAKLIAQQQRQLQQVTTTLQHKQATLEKLKPQQFEFHFATHKTGEILRLQQLQLPFLTDTYIDLALHAQEKIHLSGQNGTGKSTLLKMIHYEPQSGSGTLFKNAQSVYLDQNFSFLNLQKSAVENLQQRCAEKTAEEWRNLLGQIRLRGDKTLQPLASLSGGEQLKVALLALAYPKHPFDLLLLDEPENHLDIESRELLAHAIHHFTGAVILVSHDPAFVAECGIQTHISIQP